jgi:predicted dinucleotide-binding enzyme
MKIAFIGHGHVGGALATRLSNLGHDVVIGARDPAADSIAALVARAPKLTAAPLPEAVTSAELVFLATPYRANAEVLPPLAERLAGKVLVDCTNPVGPGLSHGLDSQTSGSAAVQALVPKAHVVKAFSIYGYENFEDSSFPAYNVKPAMMFCGDDDGAKARLATLVAELGFEPLDVGGLVQALHLEHMTLLWVRMVRMKGHSPHMAWAALRR